MDNQAASVTNLIASNFWVAWGGFFLHFLISRNGNRTFISFVFFSIACQLTFLLIYLQLQVHEVSAMPWVRGPPVNIVMKRTGVLTLILTVAVDPADNDGGGAGSVFTTVSLLPGLLTFTGSVFTEVGQAVTNTLAFGGGTGGD